MAKKNTYNSVAVRATSADKAFNVVVTHIKEIKRACSPATQHKQCLHL